MLNHVKTTFRVLAYSLIVSFLIMSYSDSALANTQLWTKNGSEIEAPGSMQMDEQAPGVQSARGTAHLRTVQGIIAPDPIYLPIVVKNFHSLYKIAFSSNRDGNDEIYVINSDGTGQIRITNNTAKDQMYNWSPDGIKIVFSSNQNGNYEIYTVNNDGSNMTRLTNNSSDEYYPSFSPNGSKIAFISEGLGSSRDGIYTMNIDGTGKMRLVYSSNGQHLMWSPDSTKIAYVASGEIFVLNANGSSQTNITSNMNEYVYEMDWSPDGNRIVFRGESCIARCIQDIFVINVDGTGLSNLTNDPTVNLWPDWSPAGMKIAYSTYSNVFIMDTDGQNATGLISGSSSNLYPAWSPDSSKIAFSSNRDGNYEIYLMNADGSGQTRLTTSTGNNYEPIWQP